MPFKSKTQLLCVYCGGKIPKTTVFVNCVVEDGFESIHDVRRKVNEQVISVQRSDHFFYSRVKGQMPPNPDKKFITGFALWDRESYKDRFFCSDKHAKEFGYLMAENGRCTQDYIDAIKKQQELEPAHYHREGE